MSQPDYPARVLLVAAAPDLMPADAPARFRADVARVRRHQARENRSGIVRNLHIATPRNLTLSPAPAGQKGAE